MLSKLVNDYVQKINEAENEQKRKTEEEWRAHIARVRTAMSDELWADLGIDFSEVTPQDPLNLHGKMKVNGEEIPVTLVSGVGGASLQIRIFSNLPSQYFANLHSFNFVSLEDLAHFAAQAYQGWLQYKKNNLEHEQKRIKQAIEDEKRRKRNAEEMLFDIPVINELLALAREYSAKYEQAENEARQYIKDMSALWFPWSAWELRYIPSFLEVSVFKDEYHEMIQEVIVLEEPFPNHLKYHQIDYDTGEKTEIVILGAMLDAKRIDFNEPPNMEYAEPFHHSICVLEEPALWLNIPPDQTKLVIPEEIPDFNQPMREWNKKQRAICQRIKSSHWRHYGNYGPVYLATLKIEEFISKDGPAEIPF